jgi:hypothetical protein
MKAKENADYRVYARGSKCAGCPRWGRCDVKCKIDAADIKAATEQIAKVVDQLRRHALPDVAWLAETVKAVEENQEGRKREAAGGEA